MLSRFLVLALAALLPTALNVLASPVASQHQYNVTAVHHRRSLPLRKRAPACNPNPNPKPPTPPKPASGKVGLAWYNGNDQNIHKFVNKNVRSAYTWSEWSPSVIKQAGLEFLPMMWGRDSGPKFDAVAKKLDANHYLGFNECNEPGQSNMSPEEAIRLWKKHFTPLQKKGKKTVCPAMSSRPNGLPWVKKFLKDCGKDCDCDVIALHWYDNTIEKFKAYLHLWHDAFPNKPIWVTEFACQNFNGKNQPSLSYIQKFMDEATSYMDQLPWVERYFAFGVGKRSGIPGGVNPDNAMMLDSGAPNKLGKIFIGDL